MPIYTNALFGTAHIIQILVSVALIVLLSILVQKVEFKKCCKILLYVGIVSEIIKIFYYIIANEEKYGGYLPKTDLPFHLCSIQPLFILTIKYTKNEKLKDTLLKFIFPTATLGAIIAIFVGTIGADFTDPQVYEYFGFHAALTVFAIAIVIKKQIKIDLNSHLKTSLMMLIMFISSIWVNSILSDTGNVDDELYTNFFYSMKPPLDNLPILNLNHGWFVYLLTVMAIGIVAITLLQLPFIVKSYKESKTKVEQ